MCGIFASVYAKVHTAALENECAALITEFFKKQQAMGKKVTIADMHVGLYNNIIV